MPLVNFFLPPNFTTYILETFQKQTALNKAVLVRNILIVCCGGAGAKLGVVKPCGKVALPGIRKQNYYALSGKFWLL